MGLMGHLSSFVHTQIHSTNLTELSVIYRVAALFLFVIFVRKISVNDFTVNAQKAIKNSNQWN